MSCLPAKKRTGEETCERMTEQQHLPYDLLLNHTLQALPPSGIRRFFDIANEMEDVISLSIGEPDFATPWHIREAGIRSLQDKKTWYTPNAGLMELRETIGTYVKRTIFRLPSAAAPSRRLRCLWHADCPRWMR